MCRALRRVSHSFNLLSGIERISRTTHAPTTLHRDKTCELFRTTCIFGRPKYLYPLSPPSLFLYFRLMLGHFGVPAMGNHLKLKLRIFLRQSVKSGSTKKELKSISTLDCQTGSARSLLKKPARKDDSDYMTRIRTLRVAFQFSSVQVQ